MSYRHSIDCTTSDSDGLEDETISEWDSDLGEALRTKSLFDETTSPSPEDSLQYDRKQHGYDLKASVERLELDMYGVIRLVNWIRREVSVFSVEAEM
jgi:protein arginine N-methyltransferase 3